MPIIHYTNESELKLISPEYYSYLVTTLPYKAARNSKIGAITKLKITVKAPKSDDKKYKIDMQIGSCFAVPANEKLTAIIAITDINDKELNTYKSLQYSGSYEAKGLEGPITCLGTAEGVNFLSYSTFCSLKLYDDY